MHTPVINKSTRIAPLYYMNRYSWLTSLNLLIASQNQLISWFSFVGDTVRITSEMGKFIANSLVENLPITIFECSLPFAICNILFSFNQAFLFRIRQLTNLMRIRFAGIPAELQWAKVLEKLTLKVNVYKLSTCLLLRQTNVQHYPRESKFCHSFLKAAALSFCPCSYIHTSPHPC